jgi:CBS domain-containing protein
VPVVDGAGALVGVLSATARAGLRAPADGLTSVGDCASCAVWVHESESLGDAFATMGARHLRELTVVGDGQNVVGVLRDVDALHFVSYIARTGMRPTPERAA